MKTLKRVGIAWDPFERNHCVVTALTNVARVRAKAAFARSLAESAYSVPGFAGAPLLRRSGMARGVTFVIEKWTALAGLRLVETYRPTREWRSSMYGGVEVKRIAPRPTLARFAREHRKGAWLVLVRRHAVAVVNGRILGSYSPRSRIEIAFRMERITINPQRTT